MDFSIAWMKDIKRKLEAVRQEIEQCKKTLEEALKHYKSMIMKYSLFPKYYLKP